MQPQSLNISLTQLWYFINVVDAGSIAGAARYMNVTQSALSKSMQALEKAVEIQLFERDAKSLKVTEAGRYLYLRWKNILSEMELSVLHARNCRGSRRRTLRIGTLDSHRSEAYLLDYANRFSRQSPDCDVEIESIPTDLLKKRLLEGNLDLAFTVRYETQFGHWPECEMRLIRSCPHVACMLPDSPLAGGSSVTVEELEAMNLVTISPLYLPTYNEMLRRLFPRLGEAPSILLSTVNASSQIYHLQSPRDFFICDEFHRDYGLRSLCYSPVAGTESGVAMLWRRDTRNDALPRFLRLFREEGGGEP